VAAFAVGADMRKEGTDAVKHAHQVDVEHPSPIVERDVVDAASSADTSVVANHMDISECLVRRLGSTLDADRSGNVADDAAYIRPKIVQAFNGDRQRVSLDIGEHHFHASLRKGTAKREPDAAGSACHECCLAGESPHNFPLKGFTERIISAKHARGHCRMSGSGVRRAKSENIRV